MLTASKANDWGSLDRKLFINFSLTLHSVDGGLENLVSYRVQRLSDILPTALKYGATEMEPDLEPLRVS